MDFYNFSQTQRRITDGAMGTYYSTLYGVNAGAPELANETDPFRIQRIHQEYIRAGADIIRTNTFASNKETLCSHLADTPETVRQVRAALALHVEFTQALVAEEIEREVGIGDVSRQRNHISL